MTKTQKLKDQEWEAILFLQLVPLQCQKFHDKVGRHASSYSPQEFCVLPRRAAGEINTISVRQILLYCSCVEVFQKEELAYFP